MNTFGLTHVGNIRPTNEDTLLIECADAPHYMLVADGMGGHAAGEVASGAAAEAIKSYITRLDTERLTEEQIVDAIKYANRLLIAKMAENEQLQGMGTTLTFAYAEGDMLTLAQVGDSSAYLFNGAEMTKLTKDHTYVQHLIDSGVIKQNDAGDYPFKNIITRALGMKKLEVDMYSVEWHEGDVLLLCSDGLTTYADINKLTEVLAGGGKLADKARSLVSYALEAGGKDNITVIIAENSTRGEGAE